MPNLYRDNECNGNCLQAHTPADLCVCACGGKNHGLWLKRYGQWFREQKKRQQDELRRTSK
jgi:hypothetical protein